MGNSGLRNSRPRKMSILEMLERMDGNLARFECKLDEHFTACPHGNDLRGFYGDSLQHARDMVGRYKRHMLDR